VLRTSIRQIRPFIIGWCICLLAMELLGVRILGKASKIDFEFLYVAGYQVRTHPSQIYDLAQQDILQRTLSGKPGSMAFYHPPYEALLFAPLSLLRFRTAYFAFIAINMLFLMAAFLAARRTFSSIIPFLQPRPGLIFFTFIPLYAAIILGQDAILSLMLYCMAWNQLESGKDLNGGLILALAIFKYQIVLPVAVLIAIRRGWRFSSGFLLGSAGVGLVSFCLVGFRGLKDYLGVMRGVTYFDHPALAREFTLVPQPNCMPNLAGLIYEFSSHFLHSAVAFNALVTACSVALLVWCAHLIRRSDARAAFAIAVIGGLLLSYHLLIYELTILLLPIALLAGRIHRYILYSFFVLPFVTVSLGAQWIFLCAVPMLAVLFTAISPQDPSTPSTESPQIALA
jgi:hypothetical protein